MYYVYMMRCTDSSVYCGITTDVLRRFREHSERNSKGAKYTASHGVTGVAALWNCDAKSDALKLEYRIKGLTRSQKEKLIENGNALFEMLSDKLDTSPFEVSEIPDEIRVY